jgi:hypothetical protein
MDVQNRERDLRHLLGATGRAHHAVYGGPNPGWARWYAEHMYGEALRLLDSAPSVDTLEGWLDDADARFRSEEPEGSWPGCYAAWILEWDDSAAG